MKYSEYPGKSFFDKYLIFCPATGKLFYKHRARSHFKSDSTYKAWNKRFSGKECGAVLPGKKSRNVCINKKIYMQHRVVLIMNGWPSSLLSSCVVSHIDGDSLNNKPENLSVTPFVNHKKFKLTKKASRLSIKYKSEEFQFFEYLEYQEETGSFTIKDSAPSDIARFIIIDKIVDHGYKVVETRSKNKQAVLSHRLAWRIHYGCWPSGCIDHIDGDPSNNKIDNLRVVDHSVNMKNKAVYRKNRSGLSGVRYEKDRGKWLAQIGGKKLGRFDDKLDACCARLSAQLNDSEYTFRHGRKDGYAVD